MDRGSLNAFCMAEPLRENFLADFFAHAHAYVLRNEVWEINTLQSEDNDLQSSDAIGNSLSRR